MCTYKYVEVLILLFVVRLPRPMEGKGVTQIFSSLQNCQSDHMRIESLDHLNVVLVFWYFKYFRFIFDLKDAILFLQSLPFLCYHFQFLFDLMIELPHRH